MDPKFGVGYQLLAVQSRNLGQLAEADKYINEALPYLDGMTERERYSSTRHVLPADRRLSAVRQGGTAS